MIPDGDGVDGLVGARHEHAALAVVVLACVGPGVAATNGSAGAVCGDTHGRVELIVGGFLKNRGVACEGCELCASSAGAGYGYYGDGAVVDQFDGGGAAAGGAVDDAGGAFGGLGFADLCAGAGGVTARRVAAAAECRVGSGGGTDAAVAGPDAQNIALRYLQDAAELGARAAVDEVGVCLPGEVCGGERGGGSASAAGQVETYAAGSRRNDPFAVGALGVVVAGGYGFEGECGGAVGLGAGCPCRNGGAGEDGRGAPGGSSDEVAARHLRRCGGSSSGGSGIGVMCGVL